MTVGFLEDILGKELTAALLGSIGGVAFFFGVLLVTPFLNQPNIDFMNTQLITGALLVTGGLLLIITMVVDLLEG